jgi:UDP-glucose 4-epimerase
MSEPAASTEFTPGRQRFLITGGAGFIGSHLADTLLDSGSSVTVLDNLATGRVDNIRHLIGQPGFAFFEDTVTNSHIVDHLVAEADTVFHLAAVVGVELIMKDPVRVIETNIHGTGNVLRSALAHQKPVLLASTSEVYGKTDRIPFREDDDRVLGSTANSRWSYAESKAIDEFLALAYFNKHALPVTVFRLFNTVGPRQTGQYGMVVPRFVQQALAGEPLKVFGDGTQSRCFLDVADAVRAIVGLSESAETPGKVFNIGSDREVSILELARLVFQATRDHRPTGEQPHYQLVPYSEAYEPGFEEMQRRKPSTERIAAAIGWRPVISLEETLQRVVAYYSAGAA